jgi:hypothetical protein
LSRFLALVLSAASSGTSALYSSPASIFCFSVFTAYHPHCSSITYLGVQVDSWRACLRVPARPKQRNFNRISSLGGGLGASFAPNQIESIGRSGLVFGCAAEPHRPHSPRLFQLAV